MSLFTKLPGLLNLPKTNPFKLFIKGSRMKIHKQNHKSDLPNPCISPVVYSLAHLYQSSKSNVDPALDTVKYTDRPMTHEYLIKQACSDSVNSTTQLLTQTMVAVMDTAQLYRDALVDLMRLLDESMERTLHDIDQSDLTDLLTAARSKVDELSRTYMGLNGLMESVEKLVRSTAEAAFIAGSETLCNAMCDRLESVLKELSTDSLKSKKLEEQCLKLQEQLVYETAERLKKKKKAMTN